MGFGGLGIFLPYEINGTKFCTGNGFEWVITGKRGGGVCGGAQSLGIACESPPP